MIKMILTHSDTCRHAMHYLDHAGVDYQPFDIGKKTWSKYTEDQREYVVNLIVEALTYIDDGLDTIFHRRYHGKFVEAHEDLSLHQLIRLGLDEGIIQTPIIYDDQRHLASVGGLDENLATFLPPRQLHARRQLILHNLLDCFHNHVNLSN